VGNTSNECGFIIQVATTTLPARGSGGADE
jgi:hypothetical protein